MSENELECNLTDARIASDRDESKSRAWDSCTALSRSTRDTGARAGRAQAAGCYKLRVIECIEKLGTKLDMHAVRTAKSFKSAISQLLIPGPRKKRRRAFPNWPNCSEVNRDVLKYG